MFEKHRHTPLTLTGPTSFNAYRNNPSLCARPFSGFRDLPYHEAEPVDIGRGFIYYVIYPYYLLDLDTAFWAG